MGARGNKRQRDWQRKDENLTFEVGVPSDEQAERTVLGSIILDNDLLPEAEQSINTHSFHGDSHRRIYSAMTDLVAEGSGIDQVTLANQLRSTGELDLIGGMGYLWSLTENLPRRKTIADYAEIVQEKERARTLLQMLNTGMVELSKGSGRVDLLIGDLEEQMLALLHGGPAKPRSSDQLLSDTMTELLKTRDRVLAVEGRMPGLSTGISGLNKLTTGIRQGEYWVIGAKTGEGKSALMGQSAIDNALAGVKPAIESVELRGEDMLMRLVSTHGEINYTDIRNPQDLSPDELGQIERKGKELLDAGLKIDDCGRMNLSQLEARVRLQIMKGAGIVYVDYLQKLRVPSGITRYEYFTEASETLCAIAKSTGVPIVILSQLTRPGKFGGKIQNTRPNLGDLKESGQIENDAFVVLMIYRTKEKGAYTDKDEIIIAKQRNGPPGHVPVKFIGSNLYFKEDKLREIE